MISYGLRTIGIIGLMLVAVFVNAQTVDTSKINSPIIVPQKTDPIPVSSKNAEIQKSGVLDLKKSLDISLADYGPINRIDAEIPNLNETLREFQELMRILQKYNEAYELVISREQFCRQRPFTVADQIAAGCESGDSLQACKTKLMNYCVDPKSLLLAQARKHSQVTAAVAISNLCHKLNAQKPNFNITSCR